MPNWDTSFEQEPQDSDSLEEGNEAIQVVKVAVRERLEKEHSFGPDGGSNQGIHKSGSAITYSQSDAPTTNPSGSILGANDAGRLWLRTGDNVLLVWNGSVWASLEYGKIYYQATAPTTTATETVPKFALFVDNSDVNNFVTQINVSNTTTPSWVTLSDGWDKRLTITPDIPTTIKRPSGVAISGASDVGRIHINTSEGKIYKFNGTLWDLQYTFNNAGDYLRRCNRQGDSDSITQKQVYDDLTSSLPEAYYAASGTMTWDTNHDIIVSSIKVESDRVKVQGARIDTSRALVEYTFLNNAAVSLTDAPTSIDSSTVAISISAVGIQ